MPLTPQDIIRKEFREAFRGYNQSDVDLFLDEIAEEFGRLIEESQRNRMRLAALQQELARLKSGGAAALPASAGSDARRLEREIRTRVRRFLEEQLRMLESGESEPSATAERIAREAPQPMDVMVPPDEEPPGTRYWGDEA